MPLTKLALAGLTAIACLSATNCRAQVKNPILPGFYPDPSICRVDHDYYLVNSSFSYFPGVPIFHSTDLVHWQQIGHVLARPSQLNLVHQGISEGIYAPSIRFNQGIYYMITTLMGGGAHNFFVTAKNPAGPWSDPNWLPEINGIDPSFFFADNGQAYIINNGPPPDNQPAYSGHRALWLQEFDRQTQKLIGDRKIIVNDGTDLAKKPIWIEGPHLFQKNGWYYLMAAEGGTGMQHSEVMFRSKNIWGPYEVFAGNPILTQRDLPADRPAPVTCTGHADMVQTAEGDWVAVFLGCQPYAADYFNTGRQTFFNQVDWRGEWPIILEKGKAVPAEVKSPIKAEAGQAAFSDYSANWRDDFDQSELKLDWNFIRTPKEKWYELSPHKLTMSARPVSIGEKGNPSFIGRRLQHANCQFGAAVSLEPDQDLEAGLVAFQNEKFYYKFVLMQSAQKYYLSLASAAAEWFRIELKEFKPGALVYLRMQARAREFKCEYSLDNEAWTAAGAALDGQQLSTKVAGGFVGAYFGLYAFAPSPAKATFDWAAYQQLK